MRSETRSVSRLFGSGGLHDSEQGHPDRDMCDRRADVVGRDRPEQQRRDVHTVRPAACGGDGPNGFEEGVALTTEYGMVERRASCSWTAFAGK